MTQKHLIDVTSDIVHACADNLFPKLNLTQNPTNLTNPYWQWVVRHRLNPYQILGAIPSLDNGQYDHRAFPETFPTSADWQPLWHFNRQEYSETTLPDGRVILIGGSLDSYYGYEFAIFNDVVVKYPNGNIEIYGYPIAIFPPINAHTATLIGDDIWIIGNGSYVDFQKYNTTPIYKLNIHSLKITKVESRNQIGWINHHTANLKDGQIVIKGGKIFDDDYYYESPERDNVDEWVFNPKTLTFKNLTNRHWQGFYLYRKDFEWLLANEYQWVLLYEHLFGDELFNQQMMGLEKYLGKKPNYKLYQSLFAPPIIHSDVMVNHTNYSEVAIFILDDIKVRYLIDGSFLLVYIEGQLPDDKFELLKDNLCYKLSKLENCPCQVKLLPFHQPFGVNKKVKKIKRV